MQSAEAGVGVEVEEDVSEVKPGPCTWCGAAKENRLGICSKCCRFPDLHALRVTNALTHRDEGHIWRRVLSPVEQERIYDGTYGRCDCDTCVDALESRIAELEKENQRLRAR